MPLHEGDISWQELRRIVHDWAGTAAELAEVSPLSGGCINTTLLLGLKDGAKAVVKISQHRVDRSYETEAFQLSLLRSHGLPAPQVFQWHVGTLDHPNSYLLMECIDGVDFAEAKQRC